MKHCTTTYRVTELLYDGIQSEMWKICISSIDSNVYVFAASHWTLKTMTYSTYHRQKWSKLFSEPEGQCGLSKNLQTMWMTIASESCCTIETPLIHLKYTRKMYSCSLLRHSNYKIKYKNVHELTGQMLWGLEFFDQMIRKLPAL